jgi:SAM-dependent methyltransferase
MTMRAADSAGPKMLNVGCGRCYHDAWVNLDLNHSDTAVLQHDLIKGLPFKDNHFDAVYHSHVLEHLAPDEGAAMIRECYRVLKPNGILRVVVPDLEQIARLYLQQHELACQGDKVAMANYDWMKLELIDQMVRRRSGGRMGQFITSPVISNPEFVLSRLGSEFNLCLAAVRQEQASQAGTSRVQNQRNQARSYWLSRIKKRGQQLHQLWVLKFIGLMLGKKMRQACEEGIFRSQGEVHRWMYDRHSLNQLCLQCGFVNCTLQSAFDSQIQSFNDYQLDEIDGRVRKPDSLFFECIKPVQQSQHEISIDSETDSLVAGHYAAA